MAVFSAEHRALTKRLIETTTGFKPGEENYKLCFQFAKSNFRFHRFLNVNNLNVSRAIQGLKEKFEVHAQPGKANALDDLTESFLSYNLEDSPVHTDYIQGADTPADEEELDNFDWTGHLMEGIHYECYPASDSDPDPESSDSNSQSGETTPTKLPMNDSAVGDEMSDEVEEAVSDSKTILLEHVIPPYWDTVNPDHQIDLLTIKSHCLTPSAHPACGLSANWTSYLQSSDPFYTPQADTVTMTEWQLVRETLWACLGAEKSFVYEIQGLEVKVRKRIIVLHLTPLALLRQLNHFACLISMLRTLRTSCVQMSSTQLKYEYSEEVVAASQASRGITHCKTYEAFSSALLTCLSWLEADIREVEMTATKQVGLITLLSLEVRLSPVFRAVQELYTILTRGILAICEENATAPTPLVCSSQLLSTLWSSLLHFDFLGSSGESSLQTVLFLWLATVQPYIEFLETWVGGGALSDRWTEFCIKRDSGGGSSDEWSHWSVTRDESVPEVLKPIIKHVFQAGKSMHFLEKMGALKEDNIRGTATPSTSFYEEFLSCVKSELSYLTVSHDTAMQSHDTAVQSHDQTIPLATNEGVWLFDPLTRKFLSTLQAKFTTESAESACMDVRADQLCSVTKNMMVRCPLHITLQTSLSTLLHSRCHKACGAFVKVLTSRFNLTDHFKTIQRFYLMGDGPVMHQFCNDVFQRVQDANVWQDSHFLNSTLHEAVQRQFTSLTELEQRLSVVYTSQPYLPPQKSIRHTLSSITLHYLVPWPLAVVFPSSVMLTYNQVFHLLLQVNWARWSLQGIHKRQIEMTKLSAQVQRKVRLLLLFRGRLLHFINNLTNYLMTRILHCVGLEFEQNISKASDMDTIISLHQKYTDTIFDRCLLNKKASIVKEAILNVLGLALEYRVHWDRGVERFSTDSALKIEDEFSKCSHFLITCLNNTVKRGSFPHLETLAYSMRPLKTVQKVFTR